MKKLLQKNHFQQYFYFICFFILCVCDQRIGSALGEIQLVCPNIVLMVLSCLVLTHYPLSDYRRRRFWIPALIWTAAAGVVLGLMWSNAFYRYQLISGAVWLRADTDSLCRFFGEKASRDRPCGSGAAGTADSLDSHIPA